MLFVVMSCDDKEESPSLTPSVSSVNLPASGGSQVVEISTNQSEWAAARPEKDDWCTLAVDKTSLKISVAENTTVVARTTLVTIVSGEGARAKMVEVSVSQAAGSPSLVVSDEKPIKLDASGTPVVLTVTTNMDGWNVTRPDADTWCIVAKEGDKLTISAEPYAVNAERNTIVTVYSGEGATLVSKPLSVTQKGEAMSYSIEIPTDFSTGYVQKAMYKGEKIAEICKEYIKTTSTDAQMIVVYPVEGGKTNLTKGFAVADGGTVVWDVEKNTCVYTLGSGSAPLSKVYLNGSTLSDVSESTSSIATTVAADLLMDIRGGDRQSYQIVKIGTQYWMAESLRASVYLNGTAIPYIKDVTDWSSNKTGAYRYLADDPEILSVYGAFYNGYAMNNAAGLAPEGWIVPADAEWSKLKTYIKTPYGTKMKSVSYWSGGVAATNITGFNALPAGYYSTATGDTGEGVDSYYWSTTTEYDFLVKQTVPHCFRLTAQTTGLAGPNLHQYEFGHSIRCVKK